MIRFGISTFMLAAKRVTNADKQFLLDSAGSVSQ